MNTNTTTSTYHNPRWVVIAASVIAVLAIVANSTRGTGFLIDSVISAVVNFAVFFGIFSLISWTIWKTKSRS